MTPVYSIILPAYNEASNIERAIRECAAVFLSIGEPFEILLVDDGSTDGTAKVAERISGDGGRMAYAPTVRIVRHPANRGKGAAVQTGVKNAHGEILLFLDCDLSVHPAHIETFLPFLGEADILIGSRRAIGARILVPQPWPRMMSGQLFNFVVRHLLDIPFKDTQCGFKVFTKPAADETFRNLETSGWSFDVEVILRAMKQRLRIKELPVTWENGQESRVRLRDSWKIVREIARLVRIRNS